MSSKLKTLQRRNLGLGGIAVLLVAVVALRPEATVSATKESLPLVFSGFNADDARRVEIEVAETKDRPGRKLALEMGEGGRWTMASHFRYPLQAGASRLLDAVAGARRSARVTARVDTFDQYAGTDGWTDVTILDSRGRTLARFALGKYQYPETFLRVAAGDKEEIIKASKIVPNVAATDVKSWIDTRIWPALTASKMIRIDVEQRRDDRTVTIVKRGESAADLEMGAPEADEKGGKVYWMASPQEADAKKTTVEDLAREFTGMLVEDVVAGSMTAADKERLGFKEPELVVTFFQKDGEKVAKHVFEVGGKSDDGENVYVRRKDAQWVFAVRGSSISRMRQNPGEFIEKPPEEPKEGDAKDGDGKDGSASGSPDGDGGKKASGDPDGGEPPEIPPPLPPEDPKKDEPKKEDPPKDPKKDG